MPRARSHSVESSSVSFLLEENSLEKKLSKKVNVQLELEIKKTLVCVKLYFKLNFFFYFLIF